LAHKVQASFFIAKMKRQKGIIMKKEKRSTVHRILSILGIVIGSMLLPFLIINIILIIEGYLYPEKVPSLFGVSPMIVVTDSMNPAIQAGDMILAEKVDPNEVQVGDIISFFDPLRAGNTVVITHRVIEVRHLDDGRIQYRTQGDANNQADEIPIPSEKLVGRYRFTIPVWGKVALFLRTLPGFLCFVIIPIILLVVFEVIRRYQENRASERAYQELMDRCLLLEDKQGNMHL